MEFEQYLVNKAKRVGPEFKAGYFNDNGENPLTQEQKRAALTRMRQSGDTFLNTQNNFTTFLNDREDLPRLSILQNYG